ncbi:MAG TPA: hypothetical protein PKC97_13480 [Burkholderiaceae bacterium]|nr:hypothetical protein [Burkholderiaceae bacterium]
MSEPAAAAGTVNDVLVVQDPILLRIAASLLAKAERSGRERAVRLKLDRRELPELYDQVHAEAVGRIELLLREIERTGWVRLVLTRERDFAGFVDRKPQLELVDFDALADWAGYRRLADSWQRRLVAHLDAHWNEPDTARKRALLEYLTRSPVAALATLSAEEAMSSLQALGALCLSGVSMPLREASAQVFHGRSKVLDSRDELLRLLGAAPGQFWEAPIQLLVDIPPAFDEALFVENLVTFERMADARGADWQHSLLIYAAGFKGSAKRLRHRNGCRIYLRATHAEILALEPSAIRGLEAVGAWLFGRSDLPVRFFGDLDYSGMQILGSLREVFAQAKAWQPGYAKLAIALSAGRGHAPEAAGKERQGDPCTTGCNYADGVLLPLMRQSGRFVDQEGFGAAEA